MTDTGITTTGTGPGAVTDGHTGWDCTAHHATLIAEITSPGLGTLPAHHGVIYVCPDHQAQAEARITAMEYTPRTYPAGPSHTWNGWPCGHITTNGRDGDLLAAALTVPVEPPAPTPEPEAIVTATTDTATYYRWQATAHLILGKLIAEGQQNGLPALTWTLATTGALTGEASMLDGPDRQRAAVAAWARHLGATIHEHARGEGRAELIAPFDRDGERRGVIRAELFPELDPETD